MQIFPRDKWEVVDASNKKRFNIFFTLEAQLTLTQLSTKWNKHIREYVLFHPHKTKAFQCITVKLKIFSGSSAWCLLSNESVPAYRLQCVKEWLRNGSKTVNDAFHQKGGCKKGDDS